MRRIKYRKNSRPNPMVREKYEVVNGKPHFGIWIGRYTAINNTLALLPEDKFTEIYDFILERMKVMPDGLELKESQVIYKEPRSNAMADPLNQCSTLAIKGIMWGRAYKVMRALQRK